MYLVYSGLCHGLKIVTLLECVRSVFLNTRAPRASASSPGSPWTGLLQSVINVYHMTV